jgi:hypothetical protein
MPKLPSPKFGFTMAGNANGSGPTGAPAAKSAPRATGTPRSRAALRTSDLSKQ